MYFIAAAGNATAEAGGTISIYLHFRNSLTNTLQLPRARQNKMETQLKQAALPLAPTQVSGEPLTQSPRTQKLFKSNNTDIPYR